MWHEVYETLIYDSEEHDLRDCVFRMPCVLMSQRFLAPQVAEGERAVRRQLRLTAHSHLRCP